MRLPITKPVRGIEPERIVERLAEVEGLPKKELLYVYINSGKLGLRQFVLQNCKKLRFSKEAETLLKELI